MEGVSKEVPSTSSTENDCNVVLFRGNMRLSDILAHDGVLDSEYRQNVEGQFCVSDYDDGSCEEYSCSDGAPSLVDSFSDSEEEPTGEYCDQHAHWLVEGAKDPVDVPEENELAILVHDGGHHEEDWNDYTDNEYEYENEDAEGWGSDYAENEDAEGWNEDGQNMNDEGWSEDGENEDAEGWSEQAENDYGEGWSEDGENEDAEGWADHHAPENENVEGWSRTECQWPEEERRFAADHEREKRSEEILGEHAQEDWYAKVDEERKDSIEDWQIVNGNGDDSSNKAEENGQAEKEPRKEDSSGTESGKEKSGEERFSEEESHQEESNKEREDDSRDEGIQVATNALSDAATASSSNYESVKEWSSEEEHSYGVQQLSPGSSFDWGKEEEVEGNASDTRRTVYEFVEETLKENYAQLTEALKIRTEGAQPQDEAARRNPDRRLKEKLSNIKMLLSELKRSKDVLLTCYNTLYPYPYSILPDEKMELLDSVTKVEKTAQHAIAIMDAHLFKLSGAVFKKKFFY